MQYSVWYKKYWDREESQFQDYAKVCTLDADSLEHVYYTMQAEIWSPNGEARGLIQSLGLSHTSMSVGDFIENEKGEFYRVEGCGFEKYDHLPVGEKL